MEKVIYILNGPNLNLLGMREPEIYGTIRLADIEAAIKAHCKEKNMHAECRQSNHEGVLVDWCQEAGEKAHGLIINAGAYTHSSIALADALKALSVPIIEVHLSNIFARETFRHHSFISPLAQGVICGFGAQGYRLALDVLHEQF